MLWIDAGAALAVPDDARLRAQVAAGYADDEVMTALAALTDAQIRAAQMIIVGSALGFFVTVLIVRFWVWAIVDWAVADLRRKKVLPDLSWEQAAPAQAPAPSTMNAFDRGPEWAQSQARLGHSPSAQPESKTSGSGGTLTRSHQ